MLPTFWACCQACFTWEIDLGFADDHGIEAGCDAEDVEEGGFVEQTVEVFPLAQLESVFGAKQPHDRVGGQGDIVGPQPKFSAVAGGHDDDFFDAFRPRQLHQGLVAPVLG